MTVTADEYRERREKLLDACSDLDLDAIVVCANGGCFGLSGVSQGYMGFLCGWDSFDSPSALVLRPGRAPFLLVAHHRMKMMALANLSGIDVDWIDQDELGKGLARELASSGAMPNRLGLCGWEDVLAKSWKSIETALDGVEWVDIKERFVPLRSAKSKAERAVHRQTAAICDAMFEALVGMSVVGRFTYDIKAELECLAKRRGCEFVQQWMTVGQVPDYPRYFPHENRQVPQDGDILLYGMCMTLDGIWGHAVRCFRIGPVDDRHRRIQGAVVEFQERFINLMQPGANLSEIVRKGFQSASIVHDAIGASEARMLRLGHGLGNSYGEPGISDPFPRSYYSLEEELQRSHPMVLQPGMVFEIHPIIFYADGGAAVGDMIEINEDGPAFLTRFPRDVLQLKGQGS